MSGEATGAAETISRSDVAAIAALHGVPIHDEDLAVVAEGLKAHAARMVALRDADLADVPPATTFAASWDD
jgi:hypothetical protein